MAKRQSLEVSGYTHTNPVPLGCRIGNMLYSSSIFGIDPKTGKVRPTGEEQAEQAFENMRELLKQAGGTPENIIFLTVYMSDRTLGNAINTAWLKMFPDEDSRPARLNMQMPQEGNPVRLQCVAVLD